jgi:Ran GTPase-activating protein (RanGAP) involved in mRNA processing and transport
MATKAEKTEAVDAIDEMRKAVKKTPPKDMKVMSKEMGDEDEGSEETSPAAVAGDIRAAFEAKDDEALAEALKTFYERFC